MYVYPAKDDIPGSFRWTSAPTFVKLPLQARAIVTPGTLLNTDQWQCWSAGNSRVIRLWMARSCSREMILKRCMLETADIHEVWNFEGGYKGGNAGTRFIFLQAWSSEPIQRFQKEMIFGLEQNFSKSVEKQDWWQIGVSRARFWAQC